MAGLQVRSKRGGLTVRGSKPETTWEEDLKDMPPPANYRPKPKYFQVDDLPELKDLEVSKLYYIKWACKFDSEAFWRVNDCIQIKRDKKGDIRA